MEIKITQRTPGLWMCPRRGVIVDESSDEENAALVKKAEAHLLQLMEDPYYLEAFQRIKKKIPSVRLPINKGKLAARIQFPVTQNTKRARGRPAIADRQWADKILDSLDRLGKPLTIDLCRGIAKDRYPSARESAREAFAKKFLQLLKNQKKKIGKSHNKTMG